MSENKNRGFLNRMKELFGREKSEEKEAVEKIEAGALTEAAYSPGYSDMNGASHRTVLSKNDAGEWVVTCRDRDDIEEPVTERVYAVDPAAVEAFSDFVKEKNVLDLVNREEGHEFCEDYSEWGYSFRFDNTAIGGKNHVYFRFGEYRVYSAADRELLKELDARFEELRGELLSETIDEDC